MKMVLAAVVVVVVVEVKVRQRPGAEALWLGSVSRRTGGWVPSECMPAVAAWIPSPPR